MTEIDDVTAMARRARTMSFRAALAALVLVGMGSVAAATIEAPGGQSGTREDSGRQWPAPGTIGGPRSTASELRDAERLADLGQRLAHLQLDGEPLGLGAG